MGKIILRIITAGVILATTSFGVYYFFQLNNNVSDVYSYYKEIDNESHTKNIVDDFYSLAADENLISNDNLTFYTEVSLVANPYNQIYESLRNTYDYYVVYVTQLNNIEDKDISSVKKINADYIRLSKELKYRYNTFESGILKEHGELNIHIKNGLFDNYITKYKQTLESYRDVTIQLKHIVEKYIYDGNKHKTFVPTILDIKDYIVYDLLEYDVNVIYEEGSTNITGFLLDNEFQRLYGHHKSILRKYDNLEDITIDSQHLMSFVSNFYHIEDFDSFINRLKSSGTVMSDYNQIEQLVKNELLKDGPYFG